MEFPEDPTPITPEAGPEYVVLTFLALAVVLYIADYLDVTYFGAKPFFPF